MNILQVLPELKSGGVETGVIDFTKILIEKAHKSVVISSGGPLVKDIEKAGGIHYELPVNIKNPITILGLIPKIANIIKQENIDIVHARSRVPALSAFFAAYIQKAVFVTTCHGYYSNHIFSRVMGWGRIVIVASHVIAKHMIEDFGVPRQRIRLIPRGVDLEKFAYKPLDERKKNKEYTIAVIGRITPIKGHAHFIRAISKVVRTLANIKVLIIGEAPPQKRKYETELKTLVRRLSLSRYVDFLGRRNDIPQLLQQIDLLVLPSVCPEAFGRVIIEALASGTPVVATKVGGVADIIKDRKNGILVDSGDWNSMARAIIEISKDKKLALKLTKQARFDTERYFSLQRMYKNTITAYEEIRFATNILVIKITAIGDVVLSIPSLAAIREKFPKAKIAIVVGARAREIIANCPYVDEILPFNTDSRKSRFMEILRIAAELRRECFDIVVDLQNNRASRMLGFLSMAYKRIGYKNKKLDFLLTQKIDGAKFQMPPVEHQFKLLRSLGIEAAPRGLELFPTEEEQMHIDKMFENEWVGKAQILVGINIGSSMEWETKRWDIKNFTRLCKKFSQKDIRVVITGSRQDIPLAENLISSMETKPINMVGETTLMELACLIKRCKLFITGDSAPLHIACAVGTAAIGLFGPTDPKRHLQPSANVCHIYKKISCSPCYRRLCQHTKCMQKISVEEVFETAMGILKK